MRLLALLSLFIFISCEQDPYPEGGKRLTPRTDLQEKPGLSMIVSPLVELTEGRKSVVKIQVSVPPPGLPEVRVEGLPLGATFDADRLEINWTPGFFDGNDVENPTIKTRSYPITVFLASSEAPKDNISENTVLKVNDKPREFTVDGYSSFSANEGQPFEYRFKLSNKDYPRGPFQVSISGMPANTIVEQISEVEYKISGEADHHHVRINETNSCSGRNCLGYKGQITAFNPANHKTTKDIDIKVQDKRLDVTLVAPEDMEQGLDITFQVSAYDLNGEVAPQIELSSDEPEFGEFSTKIVKDQENNSSVLNVTWKDIPPTYNNTKRFFSFKACVLDTSRRYRNCNQETTDVKIVVKERKPPTFDRSNWAAGVIKYLKHKEYDTEYIYIQDGDSLQDITNVKIMPESMRKYVSWNNDKLTLKNFDKEGIYQFSLVAKSEYNMSTAESFVVEVFSKNRSKTLYFTDSTRDNEAKFYRDTLKNIELMNPMLQILNERNLSGREILVIGTSMLSDDSMSTEITRAMDKIKNIIVATPLIENMPKKFLDKLKIENKVAIIGRYTDLPDTPDLSTMNFVYRKDFDIPSMDIGLQLKATVESDDPIIFSTGVDTNNCADVLELTDAQKLTRYKIGVICKRENGGRLAVLGTEFADLKASLADKDIPSKWFQKMLSTKIFIGRNK